MQTVCGNVCGFAYVLRIMRMFVYVFFVCIRILRTFVYSFCARCADFAYVYRLSFAKFVLLFRTYTSFVRVKRLYVRIRIIFWNVLCGQSRGIQTCTFLDLFCPCKRSWFVDSLKDTILRVPSISLSSWADRYYWEVSRIRSWGFCRGICPRELFVIHRPILPQRFLVDLDRAIYFTGGVILLCNMLLCGSYKFRYKGYFGCNYDILDWSRRSYTPLLLTRSCLQVNTY